MQTKLSTATVLVTAMVVVISSCKKEGHPSCNCTVNDIVATASVYATGLNNPRGLKFGPDGDLYVAEGGIGGADSSVGQCFQVPGVGPYTGSVTGSDILKIKSNGSYTKVADNLPSSQTTGDFVSGVADVTFVGNTLYAVLAGAGCSHGVPSVPNGIIKVLTNEKWEMIADLSTFLMDNPVKNPNPGDFEPDGTWYSLFTLGDEIYAIEPNHGEIDKISLEGNISRVVDISATQGHIVPSSMVYHDGDIYFGNVGTFPVTGNCDVYKLSSGGTISKVDSGFSMITGITFDQLGGLYVLEASAGQVFPIPGSGDVVRIDPSGARKTILTGLNEPGAFTLGPDNNLYISNNGFGANPGQGQIVKATITCQPKEVNSSKTSYGF